jgi:hypothetical protein
VASAADLDPIGPAYQNFTGPALDRNIEPSRTEPWRRADIGATNGHGNARSIARIQSAVASGGCGRRRPVALADDD